MKRMKTSPYYIYMAPFFESGNAQLIEQAKKDYRKMYKREWKKVKRKAVKEITLALSSNEYKEIKEASEKHHTKVSPFIKKASIAYIRKVFIVPNETAIEKIIQILKMMYISTENYIEEGGNDILGKKILSQLDMWEKEIRVALINPLSFEQFVKKYIEEHREEKQHLLTLLNTL